MNEEPNIVTYFGIPFNVGNVTSGLITAVLMFCLLFWLSRKIQMKPTGKQNVIEWIIDFTNGIIKNALPDEEGKNYSLLAFTLFVFIFLSNQIGLIFEFEYNGHEYLKSPTSTPITTITLAFMVILLSHYLGVKKFGFGGYIKNSYLSPMPALLPISILEQFTNFLTLALRLYGNIFAGEVLLKLIFSLAKSHGILTYIPAIPLEILWQGFSVFIGSIQAYVFVTLTMVYISQKVEKE
ncbi:atp synthase a chain [Ligilactobacillus hayakitensis DSM 18933 = JCM 14209]|uniref:ATP synthase subunit a n=1 Tax=Ligilactobacillus hayakitensis DSM 18933 = JCM 14209 TaxID=1423755 RepID=A0A0R1WLX0_9LACO|nr:F0F1 ATP synthase subunit A [Ligilactobacillus hayakitensis]KRM18839.1 atp synthase a chain [Ligilactobacillus hayakitensis DSM 18933 = JCM 14209]